MEKERKPTPEDDCPIPPPGEIQIGRKVPPLLEDPEQILCFCFDVTVQEAMDILRGDPSHRIADITAKCEAGGGCGSCRLDIAMLIEYVTGKEADFSFE